MQLAQTEYSPSYPIPGDPLLGLGTSEKSLTRALKKTGANVTVSKVLLSGSEILTLERGDALQAVSEAVRLADIRGRDELTIESFATVEGGEIDQQNVNDLQDALEDLVAAACDQMAREFPVTRLTRHATGFDLRCYMGGEKPTDYVHIEDWISDSR